jgi:hypothetical protein
VAGLRPGQPRPGPPADRRGRARAGPGQLRRRLHRPDTGYRSPACDRPVPGPPRPPDGYVDGHGPGRLGGGRPGGRTFGPLPARGQIESDADRRRPRDRAGRGRAGRPGTRSPWPAPSA